MSQGKDRSVSRRMFLTTIGSFAVAIGILGGYATSLTPAVTLVMNAETERLINEVKRLRASNESLRKLWTEK